MGTGTAIPALHTPQHPQHSACSSAVPQLCQPRGQPNSASQIYFFPWNKWMLDNTLLCFKKKNKQLVFLKIKLTQNLSIISNNMIEGIRGSDPAGAYKVRLPQREIAVYRLSDQLCNLDLRLFQPKCGCLCVCIPPQKPGKRIQAWAANDCSSCVDSPHGRRAVKKAGFL